MGHDPRPLDNHLLRNIKLPANKFFMSNPYTLRSIRAVLYLQIVPSPILLFVVKTRFLKWLV